MRSEFDQEFASRCARPLPKTFTAREVGGRFASGSNRDQIATTFSAFGAAALSFMRYMSYSVWIYIYIPNRQALYLGK